MAFGLLLPAVYQLVKPDAQKNRKTASFFILLPFPAFLRLFSPFFIPFSVANNAQANAFATGSQSWPLPLLNTTVATTCLIHKSFSRCHLLFQLQAFNFFQKNSSIFLQFRPDSTPFNCAAFPLFILEQQKPRCFLRPIFCC